MFSSNIHVRFGGPGGYKVLGGLRSRFGTSEQLNQSINSKGRVVSRSALGVIPKEACQADERDLLSAVHSRNNSIGAKVYSPKLFSLLDIRSIRYCKITCPSARTRHNLSTVKTSASTSSPSLFETKRSRHPTPLTPLTPLNIPSHSKLPVITLQSTVSCHSPHTFNSKSAT